VPAVTKKSVWMSGYMGHLACDKKEHSLLKGQSASAARAERYRNGPMVIAVHRRCDKNAPAGPGFTTRQQNSPRAPHIYKYTTKSIIPHSIQNPRPRNLSF